LNKIDGPPTTSVKIQLKEPLHFLISIGGRKSPPHTKNDVSKGWQFSTTSIELCNIVPLEKHFDGISNLGISPTGVAFPSRC